MVATSTPSSSKSSSAGRPCEADFFQSGAPLGFAGGDTSLYRYVGNNPLNAADPSGLAAIQLAPKLDPNKTQRVEVVVNNVRYGTVTIRLTKAKPTDDRFGLYLDFDPDPKLGTKKEDFGWIQHIVHLDVRQVEGKKVVYFEEEPRYDNGALTGTIGGRSDPRKRFQPNEENRPQEGPWKGAPWFGGEPNAAGEHRDGHTQSTPLPHPSLWDRPESDVGARMSEEYIAQLVCAKGKGEVLFSYYYYVEKGDIHGGKLSGEYLSGIKNGWE